MLKMRFMSHSFMLFRLFTIVMMGLLFGGLITHSQSVQAQEEPAANDDILFISQREDGWKAYLISPDGSNERRVTTQLNFPRSYVNEYAAVFSPDRTQIVIAMVKSTNEVSEHRLYRINADGKGLKLLWRGRSDYLNPIWSPDGEKILFRGFDDIGSDLYVINSDGSDLKRLTEDGISSFDSLWSPDGKQILFASLIDGEAAVSLINADGTDLHMVVSGYGDFIWSPDGLSIVLASGDDLSLIDVSTGESERLAHMDNLYSPVWSPDGTQIAFLSREEDQNSVYVMDMETSELTPIMPGEGLGLSCLNWHPNGEQLIAIGFPWQQLLSDTKTNIYSMAADGSEAAKPLTGDAGTDVLPNCLGLFG